MFIFPLTENDDTPEQIITDVYAACSPEDVRPLTDTVIVAAPTRMEYAMRVDVTLYDNADATGTQADITAALRDYAAEKRRKLGQDIIRSHIAQICRIGAVYDVAVTEPAENIVVTDAAFATCTEIAVNITGFNRG